MHAEWGASFCRRTFQNKVRQVYDNMPESEREACSTILVLTAGNDMKSETSRATLADEIDSFIAAWARWDIEIKIIDCIPGQYREDTSSSATRGYSLVLARCGNHANVRINCVGRFHII